MICRVCSGYGDRPLFSFLFKVDRRGVTIDAGWAYRQCGDCGGSGRIQTPVMAETLPHPGPDLETIWQETGGEG